MKITKILISLIALFLVSACSTTQVNVAYAPNNAIAVTTSAKSVIAMGPVKDSRNKDDPNRLGAIRDGFGSPLKKLETDKPVADVVGKAVADGLASVQLLTTAKGKYTLNLDVVRFDCNQYARREAHLEMKVSLIDNASRGSVYTKTIKADKVNGSAITLDAGIFASVDDLRQVANDTLQDGVEQLLKDPAFSAAIH